jgi:phage tail tape-measure protein
MQELGVWSTASGTSEAFLEYDIDNDGIGATELPAWASGALKGAMAGAATGAAAGPYGALIGAAAGGALGAASSASTPAPAAAAPAPKNATPGAVTKPADASSARVIQALQQFAAIVPSLVQLVAASGQGGKESGLGDAGENLESVDASDWGPDSFEGMWTLP